jgi:hypothetical protein
MQPIARRSQRQAESGTTEYSTGIPYIYHRTGGKGAPPAQIRDPLARHHLYTQQEDEGENSN